MLFCESMFSVSSLLVGRFFCITWYDYEDNANSIKNKQI